MPSAVIGALRVNLGLDSAAFDKGAKDATSSMEKLGANVRKAGLAITAALSAAAVGIGVAIRGSINEADKLSKTAQQIGVPVEALSQLKYAAELSGVSFEGLTTALGRFNRNIVESAQGLQTPTRAFKALDIEIKNADGSLKTVTELLPQLADRFAKMRDGPEKTALAMQLLGRAGATMIPLLNSGAAGINKLTAEADKLGLTVSGNTGIAAEAFNDNLTRLRRVFDGIINQVTAQIIPALLKISERFLGLVSDGAVAQTAIDLIVKSLKELFIAGSAVILFFQRLGAELSALRTFLQTDIFSGKILENFAKFRAVGEETKRQFANLRSSIEGLFVSLGDFPSGDEPANNLALNLNKTATAAGSAQKALESYLLTAAKRQASMQAELQTIGLGIAAHTRLNLLLGLETIAKEKNIVITDAMRAKAEALASSMGLLAQRLEESKTRFNAVKSAVEGIATRFEDAFVGIIDGSKNTAEAFRDLAKSILSDLARLIVKLLITIPLAQTLMSILGGGFGGFGGFGGIFSLFGFKHGGSFKAGDLMGFAEGGSFRVGGTGGFDSQMVAFRASPQERVTVENPGDQTSAGQELTIRGIRPNDLFTGDMVRSLAEKLIGFQRDGGQVVLAPT